MRQVVFSDSALADLEGVWQYTFDRWGDEQAKHFSELIDEKLRLIVENPMVGSAFEPRPGMRVFTVQVRAKADGQRIFYRTTETEVRVIRILHTKMDELEYLDEV